MRWHRLFRRRRCLGQQAAAGSCRRRRCEARGKFDGAASHLSNSEFRERERGRERE